MSKNGFKLVIFDCDGVLVDSEPIINRIFAEMLTEVGFPITHAEVTQKFIGKSFKTCLEIIEQSYEKPLPQNFIELCKKREFAALQQELQAVSGINELLEQITLPKCVASNSSHRHIQLVLKLTGLIHQFEGKIYSCYDVPRPKPFPDVYLYAAEQMNTNPEHCVVIEDSVPGVQSGCAAGMTVFGYAQHSYCTALTAAGAKIVFNDMRQLSQLL
ncbi:HAD family hydrolase [Anabaena cylindrica FACHB-243]|uniref:HAD-superfamily hydrolase, subfamily IA, variant 3 n=1 Tax=Anabaena cylindrica (strain ATCC 27899 / PCC 7122) TaxID=272123 RepID=K9ZDZ7_ANACC|nr:MULTISPECIES: HAD family hydrolase [Anabaena]AFZ56807.1 HAD-superfamily hydrolase, subfamily IA, variant 3 [Anabaena cylindrica PCC 7122]MBD2418603.1 HAD family hydrolase [Anabaena cylindrica FACHB-243]MBY5283615.1 HAD family hydrolase [Anabaena sp. CCAP 1446/1C]MBY5311285.1 HAD family hydrolase [Anabaena sp. CCAP 1446/1C]MCM2409348.1 HAD family hydrolase [Anabaena sp. CCAP 1446/1C]